jgi:uncharacterized membrane protein YgcG
VLLRGPSASGAEAFKLALLELVARGRLRMVETMEQSSLGDVVPARVLARGDQALPPAEPVLASVWTLYNSIPARAFADGTEGVTADELAREAQRRYRPLGQFTERIVLSVLLDRGLYAYESYRIFWLIPARRLTVTPAGAAARAELEARLEHGRAHLAEWVDREPAQALAYAALAGPAILLLTEMHPALGRLRRDHAATAGGDVAETPPGEADDAPAERDQQPADLALDLDALAGLDHVFAVIDGAVDGSGGDSGPPAGSDGGLATDDSSAGAGSGSGDSGGGDSGGGDSGD